MIFANIFLLLTSPTKSETTQKRLTAVESSNPLIREGAQNLLSRFGSFQQIDRSERFTFEMEGKPQFLQVTPLQDGRGLNWLMAVVIPKADFTAQIDANTRHTIVLCLVALAVATLLGRGKVIGLAPEQPNYRILVVDDEADNRLLLLDLLTSVGFSVQQASNGREATELWQAWQPHLIWMDLRMPIMNGYEATKRIRQTESELDKQGVSTKIIALTASAFKEERDITLASGFDDFVIKPFEESVIWSKMSQHLGVELIYQQSVQNHGKGLPKTISQEQVTSADLAADLKGMPSQWLGELRQASSQLRGKKVMELIKAIGPEKAALAAQLRTLADNYQFDEIVKLLNFS